VDNLDRAEIVGKSKSIVHLVVPIGIWSSKEYRMLTGVSLIFVN
jgi:hypothetical protein